MRSVSNVCGFRDVKNNHHCENWNYVKDFAEIMERCPDDGQTAINDLSTQKGHFGWQLRSSRCPNRDSHHEVQTWRRHCVIAREFEAKLASLRSKHESDFRQLKAAEWRRMKNIIPKGRPRRWRYFPLEEEGESSVRKTPSPKNPPPSPPVPIKVSELFVDDSTQDKNHGKRWNVKASAKNDTRPTITIVFRM